MNSPLLKKSNLISLTHVWLLISLPFNPSTIMAEELPLSGRCSFLLPRRWRRHLLQPLQFRKDNSESIAGGNVSKSKNRADKLLFKS